MDYIIGKSKPAPAASVASAGNDPIILDGNQASFMQDVIEASRAVPVLVDFWATWCGPCKTLTPALEKIVRAAGGRLRLVKIDVDQNRALVQQLSQLGLPLQSVPTVAAFWQGQIADVFQGALPDSELKRFAETLLKLAGGAMPATDLIAEGRAHLEAGKAIEAADAFSAVLNEDRDSPEAWGGLIRALLALGDEEQAAEALAEVPAKIATHAEIEGARAALALAAQGRAAIAQTATFTARLAANENDHQARFELANALNAAGKRAEAADALLEIFKRDRAWNEDAARQQLLSLFAAWGFDDPATMAARRKLSALLFS
jgi:putative thioredoxin